MFPSVHVVAAAVDTEPRMLTVALSAQLLNCNFCRHPLTPPIHKCGEDHLVCPSPTCRGRHDDSCSLAVGHSKLADVFAFGVTAPCGYERYGCEAGGIVYHLAADHGRACPHAPCGCPERGCGFFGSPQMLLDHVTGPDHSRPTANFRYGEPRELMLPSSHSWFVLVGEEDKVAAGADGHRNVFLVSVGERREGEDATTAVSVVCVRDDGGAPGAAQFWCRLSVKHSSDGTKVIFKAPRMASSSLSGGAPAPGKMRTLPVPKDYLSGDCVLLNIQIGKVEPPTPLPHTTPAAAILAPCPAVVPVVDAAIQTEPQMLAGASTVALTAELLNCWVCRHPLAPPIVKCGQEHLVCPSPTCRGSHDDSCGLAVDYSKLADAFAFGATVPCRYERYGCEAGRIVYHLAADHHHACRYAPCGCPERGCGFFRSRQMLLDHVSGPEHSRPILHIRYGQPWTGTLPLSPRWYVLIGLEDQATAAADRRRDVFLVSVGERREGDGEGATTAVSVLCVRANGGAPRAAQFSCRIAVKHPSDGTEVIFKLPRMTSSSLSGRAPAAIRTLPLPVPNDYFAGDGVPLTLHINKLQPPALPLRITTAAATRPPCPDVAVKSAGTDKSNKKRKASSF